MGGFLEKERMELLNVGENSTTSAYRVCGFYPFNPDLVAWQQVLLSLGTQIEEVNKKDDDGKRTDMKEYEIRVKHKAKNVELTNDET